MEENINKNKNLDIETYSEKIDSKDKYWYAKEVTQHIIKFLQKIFPQSIIVREFDKIDIIVLDENLPVELQATSLTKNLNKNYVNVRMSTFEDNIRRQIEQNIETSGRCWFFFDEKLLRYLNDSSIKKISINLDWLYQLWKVEKVRIFTITYNGTIKEMTKEDWKFLPKMSQTCKLSVDNDYRMLQKNKVKIFYNTLKSLKFTTEEITNMYNSFTTKDDRKKYYSKFENYLNRSGSTKREILYADVIGSTHHIVKLNKALHGNIEDENIDRHLVQHGTILGLFEKNDIHTNSVQLRIRFSDKYNVAKYFPGYIKNKEMWDYLKTRWLDRSEFYGIVTGTYQYTLIKKQSTIADYD